MMLLAKALGVSAERTGGYPAWEYDKGSKLEEQAISLHNEMFETPANVNAVHAGLECGLLKGILPNTQMISFGPTIVSPTYAYRTRPLTICRECVCIPQSIVSKITII